MEGAANPRALVFSRWLAACRLHQPIGVLVPGAVGEIVAEHGSGGLRLIDDAQGHITFAQSHQGFFDMPRGLILRYHHFETVDGADEIALIEVEAPDIHLLAGELIARHGDFFWALMAYSLFGYLRTTSCSASIALSARA